MMPAANIESTVPLTEYWVAPGACAPGACRVAGALTASRIDAGYQCADDPVVQSSRLISR